DQPVGAGALLAASRDISATSHLPVLKLDLLCVDVDPNSARPDAIIDHAPRLTPAEARALFDNVLAKWREAEPDLARDLEILAIDENAAALLDRSGRRWLDLAAWSPVSLVGQVWTCCKPEGEHAEVLARLIDLGVEALAESEVNRARVEAGLLPANIAWPWGCGTLAPLPDFREHFNLRAAIATDDAVSTGLARLIGWDRLPLPDLPFNEPLTAIEAIGREAAEAIDRYDLVCAYIAEPARAAMNGNADAKIRALEHADKHVIKPILDKLHTYGDAETAAPAELESTGWRILVACDIPVSTQRRLPLPLPAPFAMDGAWVRSVLELPFTEDDAARGDVIVEPGCDLMEYFLLSSMRAPRRKSQRATQNENDE
ncbi:MAG: hypothetical protein VYC34_00405, partial [Planctomycetota bacterium]|nr:hypothetical protein [Planctomycetota bacterium]